jgi:pimeloyl-ACP methyl ester carboxylesterase
LQPGLTIEDFATDVANVIETEELQRVILVGHSFAGGPISVIADRMPEALKCPGFTVVSCPRNSRYIVAIKMGRRQGGPSRTGGRREHKMITSDGYYLNGDTLLNSSGGHLSADQRHISRIRAATSACRKS